ncbi:MAG: MFS transporter [Anaerolineales bacterium]|nr:MAG: MFS transporter [Anaerolineales bacterium]
MNTVTTNKQGWQKNFFTIWSGQAFSLLGSQLVGFALIWHLTASTGSATVLTIAAMMEWLPRVFIGPFAGALVDRWNRRFVMLAADSLTALATGAMIYLGWSGVLEIWHIYTLMLVRSIGGSFHFPAMLASTSLMVPEEQLSRIQGLNQLLQGVMSIAAPPLGALLVELLPLHGVLAVDIGTAALAITPLLFAHIPQPEKVSATEPGKASVWSDMREGLQYVWAWSGLRKVIFLAILINAIFMPAFTLLPLLVKEEFSGGAMQIATVQASWAAGFLLGGLLLATWGGFRSKMLTAILAMFGSGAGLLLVGMAPQSAMLLVVGGMLIAGLMNVLVNGPAMALLQSIVQADMQGRVMSLLVSLANAMTPLGLAFAGPLAEFTGVRSWFILTSLTFALAGLFSLANADVRYIENGKRVDALGHDTQAITAAKAS